MTLYRQTGKMRGRPPQARSNSFFMLHFLHLTLRAGVKLPCNCQLISFMDNSWSILRSLPSFIGAQASKLGAWKFVLKTFFSIYISCVCQVKLQRPKKRGGVGQKSDVLGQESAHFGLPKTGSSEQKQKPGTNAGSLPMTKRGFASCQVQEVQEVQLFFD